MPTYVYKFVDTGETIEVQQSFTDDSLTEAAHPESGEVMAVKKVFQPVGVTFRGSGFFKTDNRSSSSAGNGSSASESATTSDSSSGSSSKSESWSKSESSSTSDASSKSESSSKSTGGSSSGSAASSSSSPD